MTDDNATERNALATVFPHSTNLLCQFHVLWALWRWLSNNKNGIMVRWRSYLFCLFKDAVDADTSEALASIFTRLHNDEVALLHVNYIAYVDRLLDRSTLWATCYHTDIVNLGRNTKNNVRSSVRMLKDKIFNRLKAFNPVQLMDFLVTRLEQYYERQLMGICNNRLDEVKQSRCFPKDKMFAERLDALAIHRSGARRETGTRCSNGEHLSVGLHLPDRFQRRSVHSPMGSGYQVPYELLQHAVRFVFDRTKGALLHRDRQAGCAGQLEPHAQRSCTDFGQGEKFIRQEGGIECGCYRTHR